MLPFEELPRRLFMDSCTLQAVQDYGEFIWENVEPSRADRISTIPGGYEELDALRAIFFVNQRANFEFALSKNSLQEVAEKGDGTYLQWAYDVLDHWEVQLANSDDRAPSASAPEPAFLSGGSFGYLSEKDRRLLQDAIKLRCQVFLTMDRKLWKNGSHLGKMTGLRVMLPTEYWSMLKPWAGLWA